MSRIKPSDSTIKKLFALSGNLCAFPGCNQPIINHNGDLIGQVCHIEAAEAGGQRYNPKQSDEERRSFNNLVLMCANHHKVTDNVEIYTADRLLEIKHKHENRQKFKGLSKLNKKQIHELQKSSGNNIISNSTVNGNVTVYNGLSVNEVSLLFERFNQLTTKLDVQPKAQKKIKKNVELGQELTSHQEPTKNYTANSSNYFSINEVDLLFEQIRNPKGEHKLEKLIELEKASISLFEKQKSTLLYEIGLAYNQLFLHHKAKENFQESLKYNPFNFKAANHLAEIMIEDNQIKQAKQILTENLMNDVFELNMVTSYQLLGFVSRIQGKFNDAINYFTKGLFKLENESKNTRELVSELYRSIGYIYTIKGDFTQAKYYYTKSGLAISTNFEFDASPVSNQKFNKLNNDISIYWALQGVFPKANDHLSACYHSEKFDMFPEHDPYSYVAVMLNLAVINFYLNDLEKSFDLAIKAKNFIVEKLHSSHSLLFLAHCALGNIYAKQNEALLAEREYHHAHKMAEYGHGIGSKLKNAIVYCHEGNVCLRNNKYDEAKGTYKKALDTLGKVFTKTNPNIIRLQNQLLNFNKSQDVILAF